MEKEKKFCTACGAELDSEGLCPNCDVTPEELIIPEVKEEEPDFKAPMVEMPIIREYDETDVEAELRSIKTKTSPEPEIKVSDGEAEIVYNAVPEEKPAENMPKRAESIRPSGFALTLTQALRVIKYFFSKNVLDAVTAQFKERLHIWSILLLISSLVSALSMTLSYSLTDGRSLGAGSAFADFTMSTGETYIVAFLISFGIGITYSVAMMCYLRSLKIEAKFKSCANLVMSAYIPVVAVCALNIITVGYLSAFGFGLSEIGYAFFAIMLFIGVRRITGGKKPLWSFIFMLFCATVAAVVVGMLASSPIIVTRALMSMADTPVA